MAEKNDSALSQEAIDALLAGGPAPEDEEVEESVDEVVGGDTPDDQSDPFAEADEDVEDDETIEDEVSLDEPPAASDARMDNQFAAPGDISKLVTEAIESATNSIKNEIAGLAQRIDAIEQSIKTITGLEKQVQAIKKAVESKKGIEGVRKRLMSLESGVRNTPAYNLYEKMTCASCGMHGAAQVKTRCPSCGKEGWFGRRTPAEPQLNLAQQHRVAAQPPGRPGQVQPQARQQRPARKAA